MTEGAIFGMRLRVVDRSKATVEVLIVAVVVRLPRVAVRVLFDNGLDPTGISFSRLEAVALNLPLASGRHSAPHRR